MDFEDNIGVYCLANDTVLDWMIAFLESLRTYEPDRRLIVIPFDDNVSQLSQLAAKYGFQFLEDNALDELDRLGAELNFESKGTPQHQFRKLASFWGTFDHFLFLDADIVILNRLDNIFNTFRCSGAEFMYFDIAPGIAAYRAGAFREYMIAEHSAVEFNSGAFVASKDAFSLQEFQELADRANSVRGFFISSFEQSFLNYCVDIKALNKQRYCDVAADVSCSTWAKSPPIEHSGGAYRLRNPGHVDSGKTLPFIHWAGFKCGPLMPNRRLFLQFRYKSKPQIIRFAYCAVDFINLFWVLLQATGRKVHRSLSSSP